MTNQNGVLEQEKNKLSSPMDFDQLLPVVGQYGIYQVYLFLLTLPFLTFLAFLFMSQMFITLVPDDHYCRNPEIQNINLTLDEM